MTKNELCSAIADETGLSAKSAFNAVEAAIKIISTTLAAGDKITLRHFLSLRPVQRKQRKGRVINTGVEVIVPAHRTVQLIVHSDLKAKLNANG